MAEDLTHVAAELYAELPGDFIRARDTRAKALRADRERELAAQVKALRRPTVAAWLVNLLAHQPDALQPLTDLGGRLREAQSQLNAPAMKELSAQRPAVVHALAEEAARLAAQRDSTFTDSPATREQVSATLTAALADPRAEQAVASGRLVTALAYAGFGEVEIGDAIATPLRSVPEPAPPKAVDSDTGETGMSSAEGGESEPAEPPPTGPSESELADARALVAATAQALEVAEAGMAQARARRATARRAADDARASLEDLEDRLG